MRDDVQLPLAEFFDFALFFADHHCHLRLAHPLNLASAILFVLLVRSLGCLRFQLANSLVPIELNQLVHANAGDFVDADQHRFAIFPRRGIVQYKIAGYLVKSFAGCDDVVIALEFLFQALFHIDIVRLQLFQLLGNPFVQVADRHAELIAARIVIERHRGLILHGSLEIVGGDVITEYPPGDLVILKERRASKADIAGIRQSVAHIERQETVLGAMGLVCDYNDVIALGVGLAFGHRLVEFLDQRKHMRFVLSQQLGEMFAAGPPARLAVIVHHAASGKGLVNLRIRVVAVSKNQKVKLPPSFRCTLRVKNTME